MIAATCVRGRLEPGRRRLVTDQNGASVPNPIRPVVYVRQFSVGLVAVHRGRAGMAPKPEVDDLRIVVSYWHYILTVWNVCISPWIPHI
jgi:hypothetical protein